MLKEIHHNHIVRRMIETIKTLKSSSTANFPDKFFTLDEKMRCELLQETLKYISNQIPFYKTLSNFPNDENEVLNSLRMLPLLERKHVYENHNSFVNPNILPDNIQCTSGTTDLKRRMIIPRHKLEQQMCAQLEELYLLCIGKSTPLKSSNGLTLRLIPAMRRMFGSSSNTDLSITAMIDYDFPKYRTRSDYYDYIIQLLNSSYPIQGEYKRIEKLHVTPPFLIDIFTRELLDRGIHPSVFNIKKITCTGGVVSTFFRKWLKKQWNAQIICNFSHTEAKISYFECPNTPNRYHSIIGNYLEVLDTKSNQEVEDYQEGKLVVTTLFPFQFVQPFIRYFMGDYVRKIPKNCECGFIGQSIEWIGRQNHCISLECINPNLYKKMFIGTIDVYEALETENDIVQIPFPIFRLDYSPNKDMITLSIEKSLIIDDEENKKQAERISNKLFENLRMKLKLINCTSEIKIENPFYVKFFTKGSLNEPYFIGT